MSPQAPQERGHTKNPATGHGRGLRRLPGFTVAAVAFFVIVILGIGGVAVANWSQSAKVTIGVTAGAAPTTAAPVPTKPAPTVPPVVPTPAPTIPATPPGTPPPNQVNVVARPRNEVRPAAAANVSCQALNGESGKVTIAWSGATAPGISYMVSLKSQTSAAAFQRELPVTANSTVFNLDNKPSGHGYYLLRILPTKDGVAGDPYYQRLRFNPHDVACDDGYNVRTIPANFTMTAVRDEKAANPYSVLKVNWTAAPQAKLYKVSIEAANGKYGAEFMTNSLEGTLTFPPTTAAYGEYSLRIQPMNGAIAGDPLHRTVLYGDYTLIAW